MHGYYVTFLSWLKSLFWSDNYWPMQVLHAWRDTNIKTNNWLQSSSCDHSCERYQQDGVVPLRINDRTFVTLNRPKLRFPTWLFLTFPIFYTYLTEDRVEFHAKMKCVAKKIWPYPTDLLCVRNPVFKCPTKTGANYKRCSTTATACKLDLDRYTAWHCAS